MPAGRHHGRGRDGPGAGKSTLLDLLVRLSDPAGRTPCSWTANRISENGCAWPILRGAVGIRLPGRVRVFRHPGRKHRLRAGPTPHRETIVAAARAAQFHDEILSFPDGYDTYIGERGVTLSGGQKQRLALARALVLDPELLILDDTFSAVDASAEEKILAGLAESRAGRTTIIVSQRLTSLKIAGLIHVLDQGRLSESGTHDELLSREGYFAHLHGLQSFGHGPVSESPRRE